MKRTRLVLTVQQQRRDHIRIAYCEQRIVQLHLERRASSGISVNVHVAEGPDIVQVSHKGLAHGFRQLRCKRWLFEYKTRNTAITYVVWLKTSLRTPLIPDASTTTSSVWDPLFSGGQDDGQIFGYVVLRQRDRPTSDSS